LNVAGIFFDTAFIFISYDENKLPLKKLLLFKFLKQRRISFFSINYASSSVALNVICDITSIEEANFYRKLQNT